jgi:hypothetical protein
VFGLPFIYRNLRVENGYAVPGGRRRKITREQFEAQMRREMTLKHVVSFVLSGGYELIVLRKPR